MPAVQCARLILRHQHAFPLSQIISLVLGGVRLEIPARERLPGADTQTFAGGAGRMHARFAAAVCMRSTHLQRQPRPRHAASFCVLLQPAGLDAYTQLVRRCWAQSQLDRPTFQDIVRELRWAGGRAGWRAGGLAGWRAGGLAD